MIQIGEADEFTWVAAAKAGGQDAFQRLAERYRRELLVHCYRILGSLEDAEDTLQETLLRAWRRLDSLEQRASLRAWLYKIATNVALDNLRSKRRRFLPSTHYEPGVQGEPLPESTGEIVWLEPLPDFLVDEHPASNPEARYEAHESVSLAFLVALQHLPGRQRAVLVLRDVLGWRTGEVAELLDTSLDAVNSALRRARATMKQHQIDGSSSSLSPSGAVDGAIERVLARYVAAWEASDWAALVVLLHKDAIMTMPPLPLWYRGASTIAWFLDSYLGNGQDAERFRMRATRANNAPAFAMYERSQAGEYRPAALHVLTIESGKIARIDDFLTGGPDMFAQFGLPPTI